AAPLAPTSPSEEGKRSLWKWAAIGGAAILGVVAASSLASSTKDERAKYALYRYGYLSAR
ncbi:MAG TPA: hypothetical protein VLE97_07010, partial [Gaiellaceae bacterium]|nr:hypothetical protein [Gaiellaceae bacterium]